MFASSFINYIKKYQLVQMNICTDCMKFDNDGKTFTHFNHVKVGVFQRLTDGSYTWHICEYIFIN